MGGGAHSTAVQPTIPLSHSITPPTPPHTHTGFLADAHQAVKFNWPLVCCGYGCLGVCGICCFACNRHNKAIRGPAEAFCSKANTDGSLPEGIQVNYFMRTVQVASGDDGQVESYHEIHFTKT